MDADEIPIAADEIIARLRQDSCRFERQAVLAAMASRELVTPRLLALIEETTVRASELAEDEGYMGHIYAIYLLAQLRERVAYAPIARLCSIDAELCDLLLGDVVTESLHRILASVAHGDTGPVKGIIANRSVNVWVRSAAIRSLPVMVANGELPREEAVAYFQELFAGGLERDGGENVKTLWTSLVSSAVDLHPEETYPAIKQAFADRLVDEAWVSPEQVETSLSQRKDEAMAALRATDQLITDTVSELEDWDCFHEHDPGDEESCQLPHDHRHHHDHDHHHHHDHHHQHHEVDEAEPDDGDEWEEPAVETIVRDAPKAGRNDPCPCGSGKKHKRCCGK